MYIPYFNSNIFWNICISTLKHYAQINYIYLYFKTMKRKVFKAILPLFFITSLGIWTSVSAKSLPTTVTKTLDSVVSAMSEKRSSSSYDDQRAKYSQVVDFLNKISPRLDATQQLIAKYISNVFSQKLVEYANNNFTDTTESLGPVIYHIANVDIDQVRQARYNRHTTVRAKKGLPAYSRDPELEATAYHRATTLASRNLIDHSSHKRNLKDRYYDYSKIKQWFADQWVSFDEDHGTAFAENVAYQYYSCNKADCTQEMITAIKKWRDFFMWEASYNWPHYRWIMSTNYNKMWMWIALVGKRYRIVTHYGRR